MIGLVEGLHSGLLLCVGGLVCTGSVQDSPWTTGCLGTQTLSMQVCCAGHGLYGQVSACYPMVGGVVSNRFPLMMVRQLLRARRSARMIKLLVMNCIIKS